ncbi:26S proteasome non-ATPase regulatory subunit 9-like [Macrobrachium nipponense]|uniref:26S proteasome non-ATPase regulatory subunit 9-like n=1 Tax=Macrobrachium nipponense TaxID=159736 RepID=UPI0030C81548
MIIPDSAMNNNSSNNNNGVSLTYSRETVLGLMREKDQVEQTLKELWDVLKTNHVGMGEPLTDNEGYPRSDIDVYQVRHARHQIKCLQNDHTALLRRIEEGLVSLHSQARTVEEDPNGINVPPPSPNLEPFLRVDHVIVGSPANVAGIHEGDQITKFGSVTYENFRGLATVGQLVQNSVNSSIQVTVRRNEQKVSLSLTPRQWSGRGFLGCNIVPIEKLDR